MARMKCARCQGWCSDQYPCKNCERLQLSPLEPLRSKARPKGHPKIADTIEFLATFEPPPSKEQP